VILLDTNVVSELMKAACDQRVAHWFLLNEEDCCLSAIVVAELCYGVAKLDSGSKRSRLHEQITEWRVRFAGRMLVFGDATAIIYGDIMAKARRAGARCRLQMVNSLHRLQRTIAC
jgi:predicted nucleic acid-binding protein